MVHSRKKVVERLASEQKAGYSASKAEGSEIDRIKINTSGIRCVEKDFTSIFVTAFPIQRESYLIILASEREGPAEWVEFLVREPKRLF